MEIKGKMVINGELKDFIIPDKSEEKCADCKHFLPPINTIWGQHSIMCSMCARGKEDLFEKREKKEVTDLVEKLEEMYYQGDEPNLKFAAEYILEEFISKKRLKDIIPVLKSDCSGEWVVCKEDLINFLEEIV